MKTPAMPSASKIAGFAALGLAPSAFGHRKASQVHTNRRRAQKMGASKHKGRSFD